jgi:pimeloyl-ACP methyl ester carboxylesterase
MNLLQRLGIAYIQTKINVITLISKRKAAETAFQLFCTPVVQILQNAVLQNAEPLQFDFNNNIIKGHRFNHPQPKKVLILHGFSSAASKFNHYVAPLTARGYEVLLFDAPAHGSSGGTTTNAVEYSEMIKKVLELYGPVNSFIAHSFGGLAVSLALEAVPHPTNTQLVLIAPATETTSAIEGAFKLLNIKDPQVRKEFDQIVYEKSGHTPEWFSVRRAVKNIQAQILWLHDEEDAVTPYTDALKVKEDKNPHLQFVVTKGLGHQKIYRDTVVKNTIINFLVTNYTNFH